MEGVRTEGGNARQSDILSGQSFADLWVSVKLI